MGGSLSVFKLKLELGRLAKDKQINLTGNIPKQSDMGSFGAGNKISQPITVLKLVNEKGGYRNYSVHQESNTIFEKIKVYKWDYLENSELDNSDKINAVITDKGYQSIRDFNLLIDLNDKLLYIFGGKDDAKILIKRLKQNEIIEAEPYVLDLSKINLIPEIIDEWGVWLNDVGDSVKKALFSTRVKKLIEEEEQKYVTTYNVSYNYADIRINLIISKEGRVSTNSKGVSNSALKKIFDNIKDKIESNEPPDIDN